MRRRELGIGLLALPALVRAARAEASGVRIVKQYGLPYLPLMVMEHEKLVEKHAAKMGLPSVTVDWPTLGGPGAMIDGLLSGQIDFGVTGAPGLLTLWDKTVGTAREVRALSAVQLQPFLLVTNNPAVKSIADFTERDRIAVPTAKISAQALCLEMAAAQLWGDAQYEKLDPLTVTLPHPEAATGVMSGKSPVNSHYSVSPFYYYELATPGVHSVLKSSDTLGGPHVNGVLVASPAFVKDNPKITAAVLAAQEEANAFIGAHPADAAAIYIALAKDTHGTEAMTKMIVDPDNIWTTVPQKAMAFAAFMHKVGRLKHMPASWKDVFLPNVQAGHGS
ncbi:MAG TPA: ABC transporter substrate-binding protein [Rhodopila sp.]|jgi:NitT/TauT family transport system substrate-binding protein|nr:ABC transporter substrate-binding protein [Rhodopila sp.]